MATRYVAMPFESKLAHESGWDRLDPKTERFRTLRFHLVFDEHAVKGKNICMGDRLSAHYAEDAQVDLVRSIEVDMTVVRLEESVRQAVFTSELLDEVSASLDLGLGKWSPIDARASVRDTITQRVTDSVATISRIEHTVTESVRQTFEVKYNFQFQPGMSVVNVAMYERRAVDVYLVWMDFLDVYYERTLARLRKKRVKNPPFTQGRLAAQNEVELKVPLGSFEYWKLLPESSYMIREENYKNQVKDPSDVRRVDIGKPRLFESKGLRKDVVSLYQLANAAFPLKWVDRKTEWTREELRAIELREAENSVWWFQNGPGLAERRRLKDSRSV